MVGRLLLLLGLVLGIGLYLPDSRAVMVNWVSPLLEPGRRWITNQELQQIATDFGIYLDARDLTPIRRGEFDQWLDRRYPQARSRLDGWGARYTVRVARSGYEIISTGPDGILETSDDITVSGTRQ